MAEGSLEKKTRDQNLKSELSKFGLDESYWVPILEKQFSITKYNQLKNLGRRELTLLKKCVPKGKNERKWEEKAWENLFHSLNEPAHVKKKKEAAEMMKELDSLMSAGADKDGLERHNKIQEALGLPKTFIKEQSKTKMQDVLQKLQSELGEVKSLTKNHRDLSDHEVVSKASGGLTLRGLLKIPSAECFKPCDIVLEVPETAELLAPMLNQISETTDFNSKVKSDHFSRSVEILGYTAATSAKAGFGGFLAKGGNEERHDERDDKRSEIHESEITLSREMYETVPTACCEFDPNELKLSQSALTEVIKIDTALSDGLTEYDDIKKSCINFLRRFGSHINTGPVHFGGVFKWKTTYSAKGKSMQKTTEKVVRDAHNAFVNMSYSGLGISAGVSISGNNIKDQLKAEGSYSSSELSNVSMKITKNGGPQGVNSEGLWRNGLVQCNDTWSVIDRGDISKFIGIWEVLPNHSSDFKNVSHLATVLQDAYTQLEVSTLQIPKQIELPRELKTICSKCIVWNRKTHLTTKEALDCLKVVLEAGKNTIASGDIGAWIQFLDHTEVSNFLLSAQNRGLEGPQLQLAKSQMESIVHMAKENIFKSRAMLEEWIDHNDHDVVDDYTPCTLISGPINDVPCLLDSLQDVLIPCYRKKYRDNYEGQKGQLQNQFEKDLLLTIHHVIQNLEQSQDNHQLFFLKANLLKISYREETKMLEDSVSIDHLKHLATEMSEQWNQYKDMNSESITQREAFLAENAARYMKCNCVDTKYDSDLIKLIKTSENMFRSEVKHELQEITERKPFNHQELIIRMEELRKGNVRDQIPVQLINLEKKMMETKPVKIEENVGLSSSAIIDKERNAGKILKYLDLLDYFPGKITCQMVMSWCPDGNGQNSKFAIQFLQQLIMLDYRARDQDPCSPNANEDANTENEGQDSIFDMFDDMVDVGESLLLHPLDIFLTIFHCCDLMLRQVVAQKMYMCRLAVPFIVPGMINDTYLCALWALRSIVSEWKEPSQGTHEGLVVNLPSNKVSFVRIGRPTYSKSKLMNEILSNHGHDTFCNVDSPQGNRKCLISEGLVEASWYLPAGKKTDFFKDVTMLLNLRGDASECKLSMEVLSKISDVIVACVCPTDLGDERIRQTLVDIHKQFPKVIVLFVAKDLANLDLKSTKKLVDSYNSCIEQQDKSNRVIVSSFKGKTERNLDEIRQEMGKAFELSIPNRSTKSIQTACNSIENVNIVIDEMDESCQNGKKHADKVVEEMKKAFAQIKGKGATKYFSEYFPEGTDIFVKKSELLPLQAHWVEWSKLQKEERRSKGAKSVIGQQVLQNKMNEKRNQQLSICQNLSPVVDTFLSGLLKAQTIEELQFFLQWLKIFLDHISRRSLPVLQRKLTQMRKLKGTNSQEARIIVEQLKNASLGLEHFFREIGQMYEAVESCRNVDNDTQRTMQKIPEIVAKLVLSGYPIEIMDGDASNVPTAWLKAVFSSVEKLKGNVKIAVLSVLGIQSSGKSTFLNTMFGLSFAVSAGRCTQGVYAQLVSMKGVENTLPFEYVLVVDAEGLRAPELFESDYHHDNELATFIVGLGDMTIVNIKGENVEEVKDILQIVAHAFLRMQLVSEDQENQKTCMFVHQNVSAIDAASKMMDGNMTLTATLDKMVEEAAIMEGQKYIKRFDEVIGFDVDNYLWCLSDLFIGDPPMAAVNPGYSESVQKIKSKILTHASQKQTVHANFFDLTERMKDLWDAILSENFVFSFKNSRAARAYAALDERYSDLRWNYEQDMQKWKYNTATPRLENCSDGNKLQAALNELIQELRSDFQTKRTLACSELEEFFLGEWKDVLIQWKQEKIKSLETALSIVFDQTQLYIEEQKDFFSFEIGQKKASQGHVQEIMNKAKHLAKQLKGQTDDECLLRQHFEKMWVEWVNDLKIKSQSDKIDIYHEVECALYDCFGQSDDTYLKRELTSQSLKDTLNSLDGSISYKEKGFWRKIFAKNEKTEFGVFIDQLLEQITKLIKTDVIKNANNFDRTTAKKVINHINSRIKESPVCQKGDTGFKTLLELQVKVVVTACRYAIPHFKNMNDRYERKHSMRTIIEEYKTTTLQIFRHEVSQSAKEVLAAGLIMNEHMEKRVTKRIIQDVCMNISNLIWSEIGSTKMMLMVKVLRDLASRNNSLEYLEYIWDSQIYVQKWLHRFGKDALFNRQAKFCGFGKKNTQMRIESIRKAISGATDKMLEKGKSTTKEWLSTFSKCLKETVSLDTEDMQQVCNYTFSDFGYLEKLLQSNLNEMEERILEYFKQLRYETIPWTDKSPIDRFCDNIWGCSAQCPFCKETCQKTDPNHAEAKNDYHECLQHRPSGVSGRNWLKTDELVIESCNFSLFENVLFICKEMQDSKCDKPAHDKYEACHLYVDYREAFPDWYISPSSNMESSTYWMWFMSKYINDLTKFYNKKKPKIPAAWSAITQKEAVESLDKYSSGNH